MECLGNLGSSIKRVLEAAAKVPHALHDLRARSVCVCVCAGNAMTECIGNLGSVIRNSPSDYFESSIYVCAGNAMTECMGNLGSIIRNSPSDLRARSLQSVANLMKIQVSHLSDIASCGPLGVGP